MLRLIVFAALTLGALAASLAHANDYPSRFVSVIVQTAPGSGPDVVARIVADRLSQLWGRQVNIVNRNGGAGLVAAQAAASAAADGYTLYMPTATSLVVLPEAHDKLPVNFQRDFVPIGIVSESPMMIAVSPVLGVQALADLIALANKKPGELFYAANNRGSFPHLTGEFFAARAGIQLAFVAYPGAAAGLNDLRGGRIAIIVEGPAALAGALQGGVVKPLAVTSGARLSNFADVPAAAETLPGFSVVAWFALMAPAGTPELIVRKVNRDLNAVLAQAAVREKLETLGVYPRPMSPEQTAAFIRAEQEAWKPVIRQAGLAAPTRH